MLRKLLIGMAALGVLAGPASAADFQRPAYKAEPRAAAYDWTGFYVGVSAGYANSHDSAAITGTNAAGAAVVAAGAVPASFKTEPHGWAYGATLGWNFQTGGLVSGIEADFQFADVKGTASQTLAVGPFTPVSSSTAEMDWFGTIRARFGFLITDRILLYGTGGGVYANVSSATSATLSGPVTGAAIGRVDENHFGWTVGGGVEAALGHGWSIKGEYLYLNLGDVNVPFSGSVGPVAFSFNSKQDLDFHLARFGINYRF